MIPRTQYARSGKVNIAYQVTGEGSLDLVYVPGWVSHVELRWQDPDIARFLRRLASFSRLITFDKRGTGMSDRVPDDQLPTLETRMDDLRAVMDAVRSQRAALFGFSEGGNMCMLFAATHPERTIALVTYSCFAKRIWSPDYPWAPTPEDRAKEYEQVEREWGNEMDLAHYIPGKFHDRDFVHRLATYFRNAASPSAAVALLRMNTQIDVRHVLPTIGVPTLVLHRTGDLDVKITLRAWATQHGARCSTAITPLRAAKLRPSAGGKSIRRAMASSRPSTDRRVAFAARWPYRAPPVASASPFARDCTRVRWNCTAMMSQAWRSTSERVSPRWRMVTRRSCPVPSRILCRAPACVSKIEAPTF